MTLEEALAELNETKKSLEAVANKNKELLNEVKSERKKNRETDIDSEKYYKLKDEFDDLKDASKKLEHELKNRDKEIAKLNDANTGLSSNLQNVLVDGGLSDNLSKVGVKAEYLEATKALLKGKVEIVDGKAVVGDKPLTEYMAEWATTDGKAFIAAAQNSGGGGTGTQGGDGANTSVKRSQMTHSEKGAYIREHGEEAYLKLEN